MKELSGNLRLLHEHFSKAASDMSRDSTDRATYKGLDDMLTFTASQQSGTDV